MPIPLRNKYKDISMLNILPHQKILLSKANVSDTMLNRRDNRRKKGTIQFRLYGQKGVNVILRFKTRKKYRDT